MTCKNIFRNIIEALSWLALLMLSIGLGLFVKDIWNDFQAGKTNDRVYSKRMNYFEHPTITFCFQPQVNANKLKIYNMTINDLIAYNQTGAIFPPVTPSILSDEISYKIGRDFTIDYMISNHGTSREYLAGKLNDTTSAGLIQVEELSLITYGKCTILKISSKIKGWLQMNNEIFLTFLNQNGKDLPLLRIFFTSQKNSYGALLEQWIEGKVYDLTIKPQDKIHYSVSLMPQMRIKLPEKSYCNDKIEYYECFGLR